MNRWIIISIMFLLSSLIVFIGGGYSCGIGFLPLIVGVFTLTMNRTLNALNNYFFIYILYSQFIVKYALIPLIYPTESIGSDYNGVFTLMSYELICIFITIRVLILYLKNRKNGLKFQSTQSIELPVLNFLSVGAIICLILILFVIRNQVSNSVSLLFNPSSYDTLQQSNESNAGYAPLIFKFFRLFVTIMLISYLYIQRKTIRFKLTITSFLILSGSTFIIGSSRFSLILYLIPFIPIILLLYRSKSKAIIIFFSLAIISIIISSTIMKYVVWNRVDSVNSEALSYGSLNAYFSGPDNVKVGMDALDMLPNRNGLDIFKNDVFKNIPLFTSLSNSNATTTSIFANQFYGGSFSTMDQIPPLGVFASLHFSKLFYPIYSVLFIILAFYFEQKYRKTSNIILLIFYSNLILILTLITMSNFSSTIGNIALFLITFTPILLVKNKTYFLK